ncbi:uncharacterized protein LOC144432004 [Styela clava]
MTVELCINCTLLFFLVDTGSPVTLLSRYFYRKYFSNLKLMKPTIILTSYSKIKINLFGCFHANLSYNGKSGNSIREKEGLSLLERDILHVKLDGTSMSVMHTDTNASYKLPKGLGSEFVKYAECFEPIAGTIKGFVHKVKMKKDAKSLQQKLRRLPFSIRDGVTVKLKQLENANIIEKINSSEYISPVVVVRKKT